MKLGHFSRLWAVTRLTLRAALHFKVVSALALTLFAAITLLPLAIKHNGSARMFAQVLLTYNLYLISAILSAASVWLACALHATDRDPGPLQLLAAKPIARWHIWIGRWLGITLLNSFLLLAAASLAYFLLVYRSRSLSPEQQATLRREILVARASAREPLPNLHHDTQKLLELRSQEPDFHSLDPALLQRELLAQARARLEATPPNYGRLWEIPLGPNAATLQNVPLQLRVQFHAASLGNDASMNTTWIVGNPESGRFWKKSFDLTPGVFHELSLPPGLIDSKGFVQIQCQNRSPVTLLFPLESSAEILYPDGSFLANYFRTLLLLLSTIALLTAVALAASSSLSFPIALFLTACLSLTALSTPLLNEITESGTLFAVDHDSPKITASPVDSLLVPLYSILRSLLAALPQLTPIESLADGRSISWTQTLLATVQSLGLASSIAAAIGILAFQRRELAREPLSS